MIVVEGVPFVPDRSTLVIDYRQVSTHTVPTKSLETPERSLSKKLIFEAFPKIQFLTGDNHIFFRSSH